MLKRQSKIFILKNQYFYSAPYLLTSLSFAPWLIQQHTTDNVCYRLPQPTDLYDWGCCTMWYFSCCYFILLAIIFLSGGVHPQISTFPVRAICTVSFHTAFNLLKIVTQSLLQLHFLFVVVVSIIFCLILGYLQFFPLDEAGKMVTV